ncbi:transposase [Acinetobacter sp. B51(2017)]|uniref:transposase n=1 Tax=Acinetobacter sp. B51(2017) TaxID=2060938 RepID=UPI000F08080B|nr:transposase [Acinetobacter sp. B51(2017)]
MNKPTPKIYRTTYWSTYNKALINRGNICIWFDSATQWYAPSIVKQGRNHTYSDAAIQCCLMINSLFHLSLRMVTGFVQSLNTSQTCSSCGHIAKENRLTQANFSYVECGFSENADMNASPNILAVGRNVLSVEGRCSKGRPAKQKASEICEEVA